MAPWKVERRREQIRRSDASVDRLVVLLADAGEEAMSEVEVHWDWLLTSARRIV